MSPQRKYYLAATAFFCIGAVLAVVEAEYKALAIFLVLAAMVFWVSTRVDRFIEHRRPSDRPGARGDA